jgi:ATP-dependent RNA/DNA helicase IGHMBP2
VLGPSLPSAVTLNVGRCVHQGLGATLFERIQQQQASASAMLTVQYRMNSRIMRWSSDEFYDGRLTAHSSVAEHTLHSLPVCCNFDMTPGMPPWV